MLGPVRHRKEELEDITHRITLIISFPILRVEDPWKPWVVVVVSPSSVWLYGWMVWYGLLLLSSSLFRLTDRQTDIHAYNTQTQTQTQTATHPSPVRQKDLTLAAPSVHASRLLRFKSSLPESPTLVTDASPPSVRPPYFFISLGPIACLPFSSFPLWRSERGRNDGRHIKPA